MDGIYMALASLDWILQAETAWALHGIGNLGTPFKADKSMDTHWISMALASLGRLAQLESWDNLGS